jgi:hypothetical protein
MAPAAQTSLNVKDEFVNTSAGWLGVVQFSPDGPAKGYSVEPGGSVFLSEEEQMLTANAPSRDEDNPFANGSLKLRTRAADMGGRRPFGPDVVPEFEPTVPPPEEEETGATPAPEDEPPEGSRPPGEEVATPAAAKMRRRKG